MTRRAVHEWLAPVLAYAGVALVWMADVLRSPSTLLHGHTDAYNYAWRIWWVAGGHEAWKAPLLSSPAVFYPLGHELASAELTPLQLVPAALLSKVLGVILAYNVVVYANFVLAAAAAFALCRTLRASRPAAFVGGLIFAFAAYPTVHAFSHLPLTGTWTLPFGLMWVERLSSAEDGAHRLRAGAMVGLAAGLAVSSSWYYAVIFSLAMLLYGVARTARMPLRKTVAPVAVALGVTAVMTAPLYVLVRRSAQAAMTWPLQAYAGASPLAFLLPSGVQALLGPYFTALWEPRSGENGLHLGWLAVSLALAAVLGMPAGARRGAEERERSREAVRALVIVGAAFLVLSLGPFLYLGGEKAFLAGAQIAWPFATGPWTSELVKVHGLPLPALLLLDAPVLQSMREFTRFGIVVLGVTAALAALGLDAVTRRFAPHGRRLAVAACALLVLLEFFPRPVASPAMPTDVQRFIAARQGGGSVVYLPATVHPDRQMLDTIWTGKPLASGDATFLPKAYTLDSHRMKRYPSADALRIMDERNVRWIVWDVETGGPPPQVPGRFEVAFSSGDVVVLERHGPPPATQTGVPETD